MAVDPNLSLVASSVPNAGQAINQAETQGLQNAQSVEQILKSHYDNMDSREKSRLTSTVAGAAQLKSFLDKNDTEGAKEFLQRRRSTLHNRIGMGENIDTEDTDYAIKALESGNIDQLKNEVNGLLAAGQVYGILKQPDQNTYLQQFAAVKAAHPDWSEAQVQDYVYGRGNFAKTQTLDANGRVVNQAGAVEANSQMKAGESFGDKTGGKAGEQVIANENTLTSLDNLQFSLQQARDLLPKVQATGPLFGRAGAAAADPDYANLQGAINAMTLQAKDLYNLGSGAGFTDADRDFLRDVIAGKYARAETIKLGIDRFEQALANRKMHLQNQNQRYQQSYGAGGNQPAAPQTQQPTQAGGQKVRVVKGNEAYMIDPSDLAAAQAEGFTQQ